MKPRAHKRGQLPPHFPVCPYCEQKSEFVSGHRLYPHKPELHAKTYYACFKCEAWVGMHPGTLSPLGRLANRELRRAKQKAHAAFDPLFERGGMSRKVAYHELALALGLSDEACHIGYFDLAQCERVVVAVARIRAEHGLPPA